MGVFTRKQLQMIHDVVLNNTFTFPMCHGGHLSFVFKGSKLVCVCPNIIMQSKYANKSLSKYTVHAEVNSLLTLQRLGLKPSKLKLVSVGVHKNQIKNGYPCLNCCKQLKEFGFHVVFYSDLDGSFKKLHL